MSRITYGAAGVHRLTERICRSDSPAAFRLREPLHARLGGAPRPAQSQLWLARPRPQPARQILGWFYGLGFGRCGEPLLRYLRSSGSSFVNLITAY